MTNCPGQRQHPGTKLEQTRHCHPGSASADTPGRGLQRGKYWQHSKEEQSQPRAPRGWRYPWTLKRTVPRSCCCTEEPRLQGRRMLPPLVPVPPSAVLRKGKRLTSTPFSQDLRMGIQNHRQICRWPEFPKYRVGQPPPSSQHHPFQPGAPHSPREKVAWETGPLREAYPGAPQTACARRPQNARPL